MTFKDYYLTEMGRSLIQLDDEMVKDMYEAGYDAREIGEELGVHSSTILNRLNAMGVKMRSRGEYNTKQLDNEKIKQMYEDGYTSYQIAEELGVSYNTIIRRLHALGVKMRPRGYYHSTKVGSDKSRKYMSTRNITGKGTANTQYFSGMDDSGTQRPISKRLGGNQP